MATPSVRRAWTRATRLALIAGFAALLLVPTLTADAASIRPAPPSSSTVGADARWNGVSIATAESQSHAFSITTNQRVLTVFNYTISSGGPTISVARMQAIYFGSVISTDQVSTHTNTTLVLGNTVGFAVMNWTLGTFTYLLAGVYELTASLVSSTGATVWSLSFFIDATPVDRIASGLIVFLLVLGLVELWSIATVGRSTRRRGRKAAAPPPKPWQHPAGEEPAGVPPAGETPPAADTPPEGSP